MYIKKRKIVPYYNEFLIIIVLVSLFPAKYKLHYTNYIKQKKIFKSNSPQRLNE